jgi:hypothetical protein
MKEKVVVLRELQRAILYTNELSKQAVEGHVNTAFTVYSVNEGARLTYYTPTSTSPTQIAMLDLLKKYSKKKATAKYAVPYESITSATQLILFRGDTLTHNDPF